MLTVLITIFVIILILIAFSFGIVVGIGFGVFAYDDSLEPVTGYDNKLIELKTKINAFQDYYLTIVNLI